jgi:hypothetical protein
VIAEEEVEEDLSFLPLEKFAKMSQILERSLRLTKKYSVVPVRGHRIGSKYTVK